MAAGKGHYLALKTDNSLWAWGDNDYGQLGDGTHIDSATPIPVTLNPSSFSLSVYVNGHGAVSSSPAGIGCGSDCAENYARDTQVTLTATPDAGNRFLGWAGDCAGTVPTCTVTMSLSRSVTATFIDGTTSYPLSVSIVGNGTVSSSPAGINCGSDCSESYASGTSVTLTATPASGSSFVAWTGACSGTSTCTLSMTAAKNVTATFVTSPTTYNLTVTKSGSGAVTSSPFGITCGSDCSESYTGGTNVILTAAPNTGYTFGGWGGACSGTSSTCTLSMTAAHSVSASFSGDNTAAITTLITYYYQSILERGSDPSGLAYYQDRIAAAQAAGQDVKPEFRLMAYNFFNSLEYLNRNTTDTAYITTLYVTFLQRHPDDGGLAYYLARLNTGEPRNVLIDNFVNSSEFDQFMTSLGL